MNTRHEKKSSAPSVRAISTGSKLSFSWEKTAEIPASLSGAGMREEQVYKKLKCGKEVTYSFKKDTNPDNYAMVSFILPDGSARIKYHGKISDLRLIPHGPGGSKRSITITVPDTEPGAGALDIVAYSKPFLRDGETVESIKTGVELLQRIAETLDKLSSKYWDISHYAVEYE